MSLPYLTTRACIAVLAIATGVLLSACQVPLKYFEIPLNAELSEDYAANVLVRGVPLKGIHGLTVTKDGKLLVGSVVGASIYQIAHQSKRNYGDWKLLYAPPEGMADDLAQGPDGTLVWTAFLEGKVYGRSPSQKTPYVIAEGLPGVNALAFDQNGRLFVSRVFLADDLYEMDITGQTEPRLIMSGMGGLNGFDFGPDNKLYGPLWFKNKLVRIDVDTAEIEDIASISGIPAAVQFDSQGHLWVIDTQKGQLLSLEPNADEAGFYSVPHFRLQLQPALDNLAIGKNDEVFITNMSNNSVVRYIPEQDDLEVLIESPLAVVGGIASGSWQGRQVLYLADVFALRRVEVSTGRIQTLARVFGSHIDYPLHVAVTPDQTQLVLTSWSAGKIQLFDLVENKIIHSLDATTPQGTVVLEDGRILWVETVTGRLMRADSALAQAETLSANLSGPEDLAVSAGRLYVLESASGQLISLDLDGQNPKVLARDLQRAEGITALPDGKLVVVDAAADQVLLFSEPSADNSDQAIWNRNILAEGLKLDDLAAASSLSTGVPVGVASDSEGRVYLGSNNLATIYILEKR
ncbi:MAG: hypothetical protein ACR2PW_02190 [Gammaproteobacteria bacterium]